MTAPAASMSAKILVIDDSPTQLHYLGGVLAAEGYSVITADNGRDGVAIARSERPRLIVMDVVMPGTNGFQATRELSRDPETAAIPVVMCSTKSQGVDRLWALRQGARDYLLKPVDPDELLACVASLVA
jgi:twitching motility two-component system response regulator PilH